MTKDMEVVARLRAENDEFNAAMDEGEEGLFRLNKAGLAVGATLVGMGTGLKSVTDRARDMDLDLGRLAASSGVARGDLAALSRELSNVTFSQEGVVAGMKVLIERGITSQDEMRRLLPIADQYADAWGVDMADATRTVVDVLRVFNEEAADAESHLDTVAFLTQRTSGDFNRLERQIRTNRREFDALGIGLADSVAAIRALEASGKDGDTAMRLFGDAIQDSDGDASAFWASLGVGEDAIQAARDELVAFEGATRQGSEAYAESKTLWDRLVFGFQEGSLGVGRALTPLRDMAPVMQGAGSAMLFFSTVNFKALVPSMVAGATASWAFLAPWLPIILAVGAAIAIGVLLWKNWDRIWPAVKDAVAGAVTGIRDALTGVVRFILGIRARLLAAVRLVFNVVWDFLRGLPGRFVESGKALMVALAKGIIKGALAPLNAVRDAAAKIRSFLPFSPAKEGPLSQAPDWGGYLGDGMQGAGIDAAGDLGRGLGGFDDDAPGGAGGLLREIRDLLMDGGDVYLDGRRVARGVDGARRRGIRRWEVTE